MNTVPNFATSTFGRYRRELHRYLMRRLRQPQDVDDLSQEVYERLCWLDEEKVVEKPLAYLYGVASHVLADHMFAVKHSHIDWGEDVEKFMEEPACMLPDDMAERLNLQQQIDKAMAQLPPTHAAVLLLHKRDGESYGEVAEELGLSIHTIEKYVTQVKLESEQCSGIDSYEIPGAAMQGRARRGLTGLGDARHGAARHGFLKRIR